MMDKTILQDRCGLDPGKPLLAGISGGPDSLCLLGILQEAGYKVIVAHFNHRLRPEAEQEAAAVAALAQRLGLPFVTASADVRDHAEAEGLSLEEAARLLRYRFLFKAAREHAAQAVAVGHTADDQVETMLMHFLRGAGLAGLKGMEYRTILPVFDEQIPLVRPLLSLWRSQTEAYCREHGLAPHIDASNSDTAYFRNRLRHALIPELERYNPRFKEALVHTALVLQGDYSALQEVLESVWKSVFLASGAGWIAFDQPALAGLPPGLLRNVIRRAAEELRPEDRDFGFEALERAAIFAENPSGRRMDFVNGLYCFTEQGKTWLAAYEADLPFAQWPQVKQPIVIGDWRSADGEMQVELGNGWVLKIEKRPRQGESWRENTHAWSAWLDADRLPQGGVVVRPRQAGDTFSSLGMEGKTIKLQDLYVNLKIPRRARPGWPLVCAGDQVVWVVGYRIAEAFKVIEKTKNLLRLEIERLPQG